MAKPSKIMTVTAKTWITPNMIRITYAANWIKDLPSGIEGAHCKLFLPKDNDTPATLADQIENGPRPDVRTYTIRYIRPDLGELDIDFVDHGDTGPASAFARRCVPGDFNGFAGPGPIKLKNYYADYYVVAADMSALPVAAATLEAMPKSAKGVAFLEITSEEDRQAIDAPVGVDVRWCIHPDTHSAPQQCVDEIRALPAFDGTVQTCVAGESSMIKALREEIIIKRAIPKEDAYISGYWKVGLIEPEHQNFKRTVMS